MKWTLAALIFLLLCRLASAQTNVMAIDLNGLLDAAQEFASNNLDDSVLNALQQVDRAQVEDFLKQYQQYFQGEYVLDMAQLKDAAATVLPLLDAQDETKPYAAWLRSRMDYFEAAQEMQIAAPPPATNKAPPANPSFKTEQKFWMRKVASRSWPKAAIELVPQLKSIFTSEGVPPQLVWLAEVESGFDSIAESPAGALGLFQLMPAVAKHYGLSLWPLDERKEPEPAAHAAARQLRSLYSEFGDWRLAVAAYNCGAGRVRKTLDRYSARGYASIATHLPAETQMYVPKVEATIARREGIGLEQLHEK